jgi:hypothetical protein
MREATPHSGGLGGAAQLPADQCWRAGGAAGRAVQHAEQRPDRESCTQLQPRVELLKGPAIHPDLASAAALSGAH